MAYTIERVKLGTRAHDSLRDMAAGYERVMLRAFADSAPAQICYERALYLLQNAGNRGIIRSTD